MSSTHSATFYIWRSGMIVLDWRISNTFLICKLCDNRCQATAFLGPFFSRMSNNAHSRSKSMGKWSLKLSQNTFVRCNKWTFVFVQIISVSILRQQRFSLILITSSDTPTHYFLEFFRSILGRCGSCWLKGHRGFFFLLFPEMPKADQSLFQRGTILIFDCRFRKCCPWTTVQCWATDWSPYRWWTAWTLQWWFRIFSCGS